MKMYYEDDVDASIVADKTIAVMGYGSQGRGQSRNMADSGLNVIIGLRKGGSSWQKAVDDGMNVMTVEEAAEKADIIHILLPEPGSRVRQTYKEGFGIPGLVAIERDATGDALQIALGLAKAVGLTRAGVIETTFKEETETDLFGEQAVLCGGLTGLIKAGFETLVEAGYQPEIAYFETCHEVKLIVDDIYENGFGGMWKDVSNTAEYGGLTRRDMVITEEAKKGMKEILGQIQDGTFKKQFADENATDAANLKEMRAAEEREDIEVVGKRLRIACGLQDEE